MRDLLVAAIVLSALFYSFKRPWAGVLLWTWLSVMLPHRLCFGFAVGAPFAQAAAAVTFIAMMTSKTPVRLPNRPAVWMLVAFICWMGLTTMTAIHGDDSYAGFMKVIKIQLMTVVAMAVLHEEKHIRLFVWVNALSLGFYGVKGGIATVLSGGSTKLKGIGGFIGDNNTLGLAMVMAIPLLYFLFSTTQHKWVRRALLISMILTAAAVLGTYSRGALLAISSMLAVLWWRAKGRKILIAVLVGVGVFLLLPLMPESWHLRMGTINTYEEDNSAMSRVRSWQRAFNIAQDRVMGAGFQAYSPFIEAMYGVGGASEEELVASRSTILVAHSNYFQVLGEHGWIGLTLYLSIWLLALREGALIRKATRKRPELRNAFELAGMCQVALLGFFVGGAFLSLAYYDVPFNVLVILVTTRRWVVNLQNSPVNAPRAQQQSLA